VHCRPEELAAKLGHHPSLHVAILDIYDEARAVKVAAETVEKFRAIDVLVNNAGFWSARRGGGDQRPGSTARL
jgi:NADP-dependent 3-hydroxy acid dehydrogenase YdfG